jgi:hypothetical protein
MVIVEVQTSLKTITNNIKKANKKPPGRRFSE